MRSTAARFVAGVASAALVVTATVLLVQDAHAQMDNLVTNEITVTKVVVGQPADAVAPFMNPDGRPGYFFSFQCTTSEGQVFSHGQFLLLLDAGATSGTTTERVGAVLDRDDGELECSVIEDAPASSALAGPPIFAVDSQGETRAADPTAEPVTGGADGDAADVHFPYTRTNAVAHVTFTNVYALVAVPTFTG